MNDRKVFIVSNGGHDYSAAKEYGELVFCCDGLIHRTDTAQMYREISDAMRDCTADDYILVSSLTTMNMIAAAIMGDKWGELHFLIHERGEYIVRDVILEVER